MSVTIKGMKLPLPGDAMVCALIDDKLQCTIVTRGKPIEWCEVLEVPTPHGRLIDVDKFLKDNAEFADRDFIHPSSEVTLRELIDEAPTIIEAEVSE